jgi:hypothetical protein
LPLYGVHAVVLRVIRSASKMRSQHSRVRPPILDDHIQPRRDCRYVYPGVVELVVPVPSGKQHHEAEQAHESRNDYVDLTERFVCVVCGLTGSVCGCLSLLCRREHLPDFVERRLGLRQPDLCLLQFLPRIGHGATLTSL